MRSLGAGFFAVAVITASFAGGCSGKPPQVDTRSQAEMLNQLGQQLETGRHEQVDLLAPKRFEQASKNYEEARKLQSSSEAAADPEVSKLASQGLKDMRNAQESAQIAQIKFGQALKARNLAEAARVNSIKARGGEPESLTQDYKEANEKFRDVAENIEKGDLTSIGEKQYKLVDRYADLERRSVTHQYASGSYHLIEQMKKEGASKWAPEALESSRASYKQLTDAIASDPRNTGLIASLAAVSNQKASELVQRTRDSKYLASLPPEARAKELAAREETSKKQRESEMAAKEKQDREIASLQDTAKLEEHFRVAKEKLPPEQADVLRRGNELVIRMKGLGFPTGKSDIPEEGKDLLNNVISLLETYGQNAEVTVVGHTDSTGSQKINQKLSEKRAAVVKDYLVQSGKVLEENVKTSGAGDTQPITSNRTPAGRKANRGVDVVVLEMEKL